MVWLLAAQLAFAYAFDMLLSWSRRDSYGLGFGPFPIIFSTNLFLWFRDDWFAWMAYKLCRNDDQLDMPTASVVVSLAAIRRPVEPSQVVEWLAEWLKEPSGVEDVLNRLLKDGNVQTKDGPIEAVRNLNGQLQFISTNTWPIPKLETK